MLCHGRRHTNRTTTPRRTRRSASLPWEKPNGGPRSLVAASSDGGPCSVMAAGTRTEPRPQRRTRRSASLPWEKPDGGPRSLMAASSDGGPCSVMAAGTRTEPRPQHGRDGARPSHGKNPTEGHGPSWPLLLMEGHAPSWPQAHEPNHGPKHGRDGARPSMENARNTDATECVPPWEKPDGGPRSLMAASYAVRIPAIAAHGAPTRHLQRALTLGAGAAVIKVLQVLCHALLLCAFLPNLATRAPIGTSFL